jgi:predicted secreted protein
MQPDCNQDWEVLIIDGGSPTAVRKESMAFELVRIQQGSSCTYYANTMRDQQQRAIEEWIRRKVDSSRL